MAKIIWDDVGKKIYETGVKNGVLFKMKANGTYEKGVPWNGITGVSESPSGAEVTSQYADDIEYAALTSAEKFGCTIEAFTYPDEFAECDGSRSITLGVSVGQQTRAKFGFSYTTTIGNDTLGTDYGYKIHIVYGCTAAPSERGYSTISDSTEAITMSWELSTTPVKIKDHKPAAKLTIDSTKVTKEKLKKVEDALYGTDSEDSKLPTPDEIVTLLA